MPYILLLKALDLRNMFIIELIINVIPTLFKLVKEGYYEALKEGGVFY